jgi:hypothetical protein
MLSKLEKLNENMEYYKVIQHDDVIGEDGKYDGNYGWAVQNNATLEEEFTTLSLVAAIYQAQHWDDMLRGLLDHKPERQIPLELVDVEDVVPN